MQALPTPSVAGITATGGRLNVGDFTNALTLTVSDISLTEGNSGTKTANFTVSMSASSGAPVSVSVATKDVTAGSGTGSNAASIAIPTTGAASSYPSAITVPAGLGTVTKAQVVLRGFTHALPRDVDVLLVGPGGQSCVLMSDVGGGTSVTNLTFTFDDAGASMPGTALSSGTYRPTNAAAGDPFSSPAPPGPHGTSLSAFNGTAAAGTWRLFVVDDASGGAGSISGGWSLLLTTTAADYVATSGVVTFPPGSAAQPISVAVIGDAIAEAHETFRVVLSDAVGASIGDVEGIATIRNDDFADPSLTGMLIKATHITELRAAINDARTARGLGAFAFTEPGLAAGSTVKAIHITELRAALAEAYAAATLTPPSYTDPTITPRSTVIQAAHILEIRAAVANLP